MAQIVERVSGRLVVVVAGAGYGKTTLLTLALAELPRPWVWCSCDARLGEAGPLLAHLAAGLTERFPGFGARLALEGSAEEQVAELGNEILETIADDFVLVLDDVHTLADPAAEALRLLVQDLPPTAHLALAGRMPLPFPLGRLRAAQVLELSERELALSKEESGRLLDAVGMELDPEALSRLHRETEGWIAGLIIAARSGASAPGPDDAAAYFEYLADEVLSRQPPEIRRFLLDTAVLDSFTPQVARAVTGRADAGDLARRLVADHLFHGAISIPAAAPKPTGITISSRPSCASGGPRPAARTWPAPTVARPRRRPGGRAAGRRGAASPGGGRRAAGRRRPRAVAEGMLNTPQAEDLARLARPHPARPARRTGRASSSRTPRCCHPREHEASFDAFERAVEQASGPGRTSARPPLPAPAAEHDHVGTRPTRRSRPGCATPAVWSRARECCRRPGCLLASSYAYACRFEEAESELSAALDLPSAAGSRVLPVYAAVVRAYYIGYQIGRPEEALLALDEAIAALDLHEAEDELAFMPYARMFRTYLLNDLARHPEALEETVRTQEAAARRGMQAHPPAGRLLDPLRRPRGPGALGRAGRRARAARPRGAPRRGHLLQLPVPGAGRPAGRRARRRRRGSGAHRGGESGHAGLRRRVRQPDGAVRPGARGLRGRLVELARDQAAEARAIGRSIAGPLGQARGRCSRRRRAVRAGPGTPRWPRPWS